MNTPNQPVSPEFLAAVRAHREARATWGDEDPRTMRAFMLAMHLSPPWLMEEVDVMAKEMGLMPEASGYLEDGSPVFNVSDIARKVGRSEDEVRARVDAMMADRRAMGLPVDGVVDPERVHRKQ